AGPGGDPAATRNLSHTRGERLWSVQLTPEADFRWCRSAGDISRALPGQAWLSLSPNMPWAAPSTVSRASSSLSLASGLPCRAFPSASVSLSSVTLPRPSLAWPPSLSFAFSHFSSALIANLLDRVSAQVLCATASLGRRRGRLPTCRSGPDRYWPGPGAPRPLLTSAAPSAGS